MQYDKKKKLHQSQRLNSQFDFEIPILSKFL